MGGEIVESEHSSESSSGVLSFDAVCFQHFAK